MKRKKYVLRTALFLVGLAIFLYPTISDKWNRYRASRLIAQYSEQISVLEEQDYTPYLEAAQAYNETLVESSVPDVFAIRDGIEDEEYESLLNLNGDGMMGYVEIPSIDVNLPIYHYTTAEVLEKGAGHIFGSSLPVGGESTHTVISAHRGLPQAKMFTDLNLLEEGDLFYLKVLGNTLAYEIDMIQVVEPDEVRSLAITAGQDFATLVTCTPYAVNTQRLLIRGHRTAYDEAVYEEQKETEKKQDTNSVIAEVICVLLGVLIAVVFVRILSWRDSKKAGEKAGKHQKPEEQHAKKQKTENQKLERRER